MPDYGTGRCDFPKEQRARPVRFGACTSSPRSYPGLRGPRLPAGRARARCETTIGEQGRDVNKQLRAGTTRERFARGSQGAKRHPVIFRHCCSKASSQHPRRDGTASDRTPRLRCNAPARPLRSSGFTRTRNAGRTPARRSLQPLLVTRSHAIRSAWAPELSEILHGAPSVTISWRLVSRGDRPQGVTSRPWQAPVTELVRRGDLCWELFRAPL